MQKKGRTVIALVCALCLLMTAGSEAAPNTRGIRNILGRIEQGSMAILGEMSLIPYDFTGYEMLYRADLPERFTDEITVGGTVAETEDNSGMLRCLLDEETARQIMENSYAVSIAPDGTILRVSYLSPQPIMFVEREKTLVLMAQSAGRGVPDTDGSLKNALDYKLKVSSQPAEGTVRWSPDSRYLFFNDTDRWRGGEMDDPYLADTQTGEIFLIDNGGSPKDSSQGTFRCVQNGCFSMDGKSFYWYCQSYAPGTASVHTIMRYDLESGAMETVYELKGPMKDFCEVKQGCWFLLETAEDGTNLIRMTVSGEDVVCGTELLPVTWKSCTFYPVVRGKVLMAADPNPAGGTYLLPLGWDEPADASAWRKVGSIHDRELREISLEEIEKELQEAKNNNSVLSGNANINTAYIKHAAAVNGATNLILTVYIRETVPDSWGGGFNDFSGQIILNTENLRQYAIQTGWVLDGFTDELINGDCFLMKGYGQDALGLGCTDTLGDIELIRGETYTSPYGSFLCRKESDPLVLSSVTLENAECNADITAAEDEYTIRFHITEYPAPETIRREYTVPEVLTAERWQEVTSGMNRKDQKKLSGLYAKVTPDALADRKDREEILASYPAAATETLYILKDDNKAANLETMEEALAAAGYTAEDYARDMELAAEPRGTNIVVTQNGKSEKYPVRYAFTASDPAAFPGSSRVQELAGLCDRIGSAVMANRAAEQPAPLGDIILEKYDMGSVDFYVSLENSEETESTMEICLKVNP